MKPDFKCGFVVIVGKPNAGKSTLLNKLIGEKLFIVSDRPQTTRLSVKGFYNDSGKQIVFLDTPGYLRPRYPLQQLMLKQITDSLKDADVVLFLTDFSDYPTDYDNELISMLDTFKGTKIAIVNKIDLKRKENKADIEEDIKPHFDNVLYVSAKSGENLDGVIPAIESCLPFNPPFYDPEHLSDLPVRFFAQEIIREGIFNLLEKEIPYATAVIIDRYEENEGRNVVHATIWIERDSQKPILIGSKGRGIKLIREYAEAELTRFNGVHTEVHLWVKVKKNWRKQTSALKEIGFKF